MVYPGNLWEESSYVVLSEYSPPKHFLPLKLEQWYIHPPPKKTGKENGQPPLKPSKKYNQR